MPIRVPIPGLPIGPQRVQAAALPAARFGEASAMSVMPQAVVDRIVDLSRSGLSRSIIASKVGLSRSAVCGCLWRRGEKPAVTIIRKNSAQPPRPRPAKRRSVSADTERPVAPPRSLAVTLLELAPHACHWPTSGEDATPHLFCGADRGDSGHPSYCHWHFRISINARSAT